MTASQTGSTTWIGWTARRAWWAAAIHYVSGGNQSRVELTSTRGRAGKAVLKRLGGNRDLKRFVDELEALGRREPGPRE
jgi:hypothetical protein